MSAVASPSSPAVSSPTVGPRSLQLLESNLSPGSSSPVLSPRTVSSLGLSTPPPTARSFKLPNPRRQSSISYFPSDHVDLRSPTTSSRNGVSPRRTNSMGIWTVEGRTKGDRRSLGSLMKDAVASPVSPGPSVDYGPLTLTEKHADLLQFIAQKESKCLELRSQLAVQEAELAELKRKWERIVSRGMDRAYSSPLVSSRAPNPAASSPSFPVSAITSTASTAIKEGVRLLAAGLDLSASEPSSPPAFSPPAVPISGITTVSRAALASAAGMKKAAANRHAASQSVSSVSTATSSPSTPSQRLSQSSASSLFSSLSLEDSVEEECDSRPPPISEEKPEALAEAIRLNSQRSLNSHLRRRSKDAESRPSSSTVGPSATSAEASSSVRRQGRAHDASLSSNAAASRSDNSGWMGSVGKKWEEMQRGEAMAKAQKRSSLLFDMSQSILSALASPTPTSPAPGRPSPLSALPSTAPASLLDDEPEHEQGLGAVMVPNIVNSGSAPAPVPSQPAKSADDDDEEWNW